MDDFEGQEEYEEYEVDPENELLMHTYNTLPQNCKKYWRKRYKLFSRFDEGIYMTSELWFSVTPEEIAIFTARLVSTLIPKAKNILDICCGAGGNSIQFAKYFENVGAIDINPLNEKCTRHNASIYGVDDKIWSVVGDWKELSSDLEDGSINQAWIPENLRSYRKPYKTFDFIFCSPPWGGPSYKKGREAFDLYKMEPFSIDKLSRQILKYTKDFGLFLPRTSDLDHLRQVTKDLYGCNHRCRVIYVNQEGYCIGLLALFGPKVSNAVVDYDEIFLENTLEHV